MGRKESEGGKTREGRTEEGGGGGGSDVAQCSVTEAVMSPMQHTAKVILH